MRFTYQADHTAKTRAEIDRVIEQTLTRRKNAGVVEKVVNIEVHVKKPWTRGAHATPGFFWAMITSEV
jgi:hypothetical protein